MLSKVHRNKDGSITLKLADFGLAMEVKELIYTVCGTPTYVAPEILTEIGGSLSSVFLFYTHQLYQHYKKSILPHHCRVGYLPFGMKISKKKKNST